MLYPTELPGHTASVRSIIMNPLKPLAISLLCVPFVSASGSELAPPKESGTVRIATFNIEDVRPGDVTREDNPRLSRVAAIIRQTEPDVILLNEIAFDPERGVADRFVERYLGPGSYRVFAAPSNTGIASGVDLDRNGRVVVDAPPIDGSDAEGNPPRQSREGRAYGGDALGFGTFPGQYAMALLVSPDIEIREAETHDLGAFLWRDMPGARWPIDPTTGEAWYSDEARTVLRLSSKSHWSVALHHPELGAFRAICAHPTPPAFDGPEQRNKLRNFDEIRLIRDYITGASYLPAVLPEGEPFVVLGDLNADPSEGTGVGNPIAELLFELEAIHDPGPEGAPLDGLDHADTARWGKRVDYVLPSRAFAVEATGVARPDTDPRDWPSDHFLVWADVHLE